LPQRTINRTTANALIFGLTAAAVILVDQVSKLLVVSYTESGRAITLIPHVLVLRKTYNTGASFGLMSGRNTLVFLFASVIIAFTLVWFYVSRRKNSIWTFIGLGLILGGALGNNIIDRLARGKVIDFFDLGWWPVFNVADIAIVAGVIIVVVVTAMELWREDTAKNPESGGA
jgi:signal peptidase II